MGYNEGTMAENGGALTLRNISKNFGSVTAVSGMNLEIKDGEFVSLLGPSGCGKTTLLRIIAGFEFPDTGEVVLDGRNIIDLPPNRRPMNMVFQRYALFPHMSVFENIAFSQFLKKRPAGETRARVKEMLKLVQLEGFEERRPHQLSGGQCQRVALGRALINEPRVLLLDEPLGALDLKIRKQMQIELKNIQEKLRISFIYVTHDQEEALVMSDRVVLMNRGAMIQAGPPKEIYSRPNSKFSATFIGESNIFEGEVVDAGAAAVKVRVDGLTVRADRTIGAAPGSKVYLAVRLEKVRRVKTGRGEGGREKPPENRLTGRVSDIVFYGSTIKYYVKISASLTMILEEKLTEEEERDAVAVNDEVTLGFASRDVNLFLE
jgi:spermidine/putrescine ABC transporter ATP-binding subunit